MDYTNYKAVICTSPIYNGNGYSYGGEKHLNVSGTLIPFGTKNISLLKFVLDAVNEKIERDKKP